MTKNNADISKVFMNYRKDSLQKRQRVRIMDTVQMPVDEPAEGTTTK